MGVYFVSLPLILSNHALFSLAVTNKNQTFFKYLEILFILIGIFHLQLHLEVNKIFSYFYNFSFQILSIRF